MKVTRNARANWTGSGKDGQGRLTTGSNVLDNTQYGYKSRFEDGKGTNPEELIGAAHAGCFTMKLAFNLQEAGITADNIETEAKVTLEDGVINEVHLNTKVMAPGLDEAKFYELVEDAKNNCPVSRLLNARIVLTSTLESEKAQAGTR